MEIAPYLLFDGNCSEAFRFYERVLGGKVTALQTHAESPMKDQVQPGWEDKVIHACLEFGPFKLMASDAPPSHYSRPAGTHVSVTVPHVAEAQRIFNALAEGGTVAMPFSPTFWSVGFGMLTDRFGTPWMVNTAAS